MPTMHQNAYGPKLPTHNEGANRSQWCNGKTLICDVLGPWIKAHRGLVFITTTTAIYSLGHGLCTLTAVPRSTHPSTFHGTGKWVVVSSECQGKVWRIICAGWQVTLWYHMTSDLLSALDDVLYKFTYTLLYFTSNRAGKEEKGRDLTATHTTYYPHQMNSALVMLIFIKSNTFTTIL